MVEMGSLSRLTPRLAVIAMNRTALGTRMASDAGGVSRWLRRRVMPQRRQSQASVVSSVTYACAPVKSRLTRASDTLLQRACQRIRFKGGRI
jgi:hypothetical protein